MARDYRPVTPWQAVRTSQLPCSTKSGIEPIVNWIYDYWSAHCVSVIQAVVARRLFLMHDLEFCH
jgi:hypothetical protein